MPHQSSDHRTQQTLYIEIQFILAIFAHQTRPDHSKPLQTTLPRDQFAQFTSQNGSNIESTNAKNGYSHRKVACVNQDKLDEQINSLMEESPNKINVKEHDYNHTKTAMIYKCAKKKLKKVTSRARLKQFI